jgi:hypothetical protein
VTVSQPADDVNDDVHDDGWAHDDVDDDAIQNSVVLNRAIVLIT